MGAPRHGDPRRSRARRDRPPLARPHREGGPLTGRELPPRFVPAEIESRWQTAWNERGIARPSASPDAPPFSIILPPPNVTGVLTIGHMLGDSVMDALVRWHRMRGERVLWVPSVDHAGLSTQVEVRRRLQKQGVSLDALPRDEVIARVEEWKVEHERRILEQLKAGGFSLDWSRYRYTMDPAAQRATRAVFVSLYDAGLVYRGERMVNWDPKLHTALSDLEVLHTDEAAELLYLQYPWADGSEGGLTVATVRPETIFGDVAVAVHPDDARHAAAVGREVRVPLTDRAVPVITDAAIDPTFGAGALKVTPRHDIVDLEVFERHPGLPMPPDILDADARLASDWVPDSFRGLDRDDARTAVTAALDAAGAIVKREPYRHSVGRSERSDAVVEPRLSTQWFVRMPALAPAVVEAVRSGAVRLHPERWELTFFRWMEKLDDWCISRQVAWGHPVPVAYCTKCERVIVALDPPAACPDCGATELRPDPDVLDTWFTSWLWPFASLGWPETTADLATFYPTSVLVTGRDIMFFWVARMMMAGEKFTGRPPFSDVYFTGMLRDETGRKISKHLGNSPDPLDLIREHGADTVRFAVVFPNPVDQDGPFGVGTLEGSRNFLTKLWNVARFSLAKLPPDTPAPVAIPYDASRPLADRWILSRWHATATAVDDALRSFDASRAATALYQFVWHDLADRYVEAAKEPLAGTDGPDAARSARTTLAFVIERTVRMLHPFVPHVTEELWHALPHDGETLAVARWPPANDAAADAEAEASMETLLDLVRAIRNLRTESRLPPVDRPVVRVRPATPAARGLFASESLTVRRLARLNGLELVPESPATGGARVASAVGPWGEIFLELPTAGAAESESMERERAKLDDLLAKTRVRLADPTFRARAPPEVVAETEAKARELEDRLDRIRRHLAPGAASVEAPT